MKGNDFMMFGYPFQDPEEFEISDEFAELIELVGGTEAEDVDQIKPETIKHWKQHYDQVQLEHDALITRINILAKAVNKLKEAGQDILADIYIMKANDIFPSTVYKDDVYQKLEDVEATIDIDHVTEKHKTILQDIEKVLGSQVVIKIEALTKTIAQIDKETAINTLRQVNQALNELITQIKNDIMKLSLEQNTSDVQENSEDVNKDSEQEETKTEDASTDKRTSEDFADEEETEEEEEEEQEETADVEDEFVELAKTDLFGKIQDAIQEESEYTEDEDEFAELDAIEEDEEKTKVESLAEEIDAFKKILSKDDEDDTEPQAQLEQQLESRIFQATESADQVEAQTAKSVYSDNIIFVETSNDLEEAVSDIERAVFVNAGDTPLAELVVYCDPEYTKIVFEFSGVQFALVKEDGNTYVVDTATESEIDKTNMTGAVVKKAYLDDIESTMKARFELDNGTMLKIEKGRRDKFKVVIENVEEIAQDELITETGIIVDPIIALDKMFGDKVDIPELEAFESGDLYDGLTDQERAELSDI